MAEPCRHLGRVRFGRLAALPIMAVLASIGFGSGILGKRPGAPALAEDADPVTIENITLDAGPTTYRFARADIVGSNLPRAEVIAIFDKNSSEPWAARLTRLTAKSIRIPELTVEQRIGSQTQVATYKDVIARDLAQGRIAQMTASGAVVQITSKQAGQHSGSYGRIVLEGLDLPEAARILLDKAGEPAPPLRTIYGAFSVESVAFKGPEGPDIKVAKISGKDFSARPTKESWSGTLNTIGDSEGWKKRSAPETSRAFTAFADLFDAFEIGAIEIAGVEFRDPNSQDGPSGRIARLAYMASAGSQLSEARAEGLEVMSSKGRARLDAMSFTGFSFRSTVAGLKVLAGKPAADLDPADLRKLIPIVGTVQWSGLKFDVPDEKSKAPTSQNIRFGVQNMQIMADKPINGIPTNLRVGVEGFSLAIPPNATEQGLRDLLAMGYDRLDLSWLLALSWNEPGNELLVRELTLNGKDMGGVSLRGVLGSVTRDVFDPDATLAMVALVGATAKNLELSVENKGFFERAIAEQARKQKKSPEDLRRELGIGAAIAVPALLGSSTSAKSIGQAVARFVAKPDRLLITARTKDPAGLGIADVAAIGEPGAVLDKLEITATAE